MASLTDDLAEKTPQAIANMLKGIDKEAKSAKESIKAVNQGMKKGRLSENF